MDDHELIELSGRVMALEGMMQGVMALIASLGPVQAGLVRDTLDSTLLAMDKLQAALAAKNEPIGPVETVRLAAARRALETALVMLARLPIELGTQPAPEPHG